MFFVSVCERRTEIDPPLRIFRCLCCVMWRNKRQWHVFVEGRGGHSFLSDVSQQAFVCLAVRAQWLHDGATGIPLCIIHILTWRSPTKWQTAGQRDPSRPPSQKFRPPQSNVVVCCVFDDFYTTAAQEISVFIDIFLT